jgi:putative ABC transport system permease protein
MCTPYPEGVARDLAQALPGAEVLPRQELVAAEGHVIGRLNFLMLLLALAAVVASALGLAATSFAAVAERDAEIGLLRALGAAPHQVTALLVGETMSVSALGGVVGFGLGSAAAWVVGSLSAGAELRAKPELLPLALLLSAAIALAATWVPLRVARRVDPVEALRG